MAKSQPLDDEDDEYPEPWSIYDEDGLDWGFADPGGRSALRAATYGNCPRCRKKIGSRDDYCKHCGQQLNPQKFPCPTCGTKNVLTAADVQHRYQCNRCADRAEGRYVGGDY